MEEMNITPSAQDYLNDLLSSQDDDTCGIKIFVSEPGTPRAETCIAYANKARTSQILESLMNFNLPCILKKNP